MDTKVYKTVKVSDKDNAAMTFLYKSPPGRLFLRILVNPYISTLSGNFMNSSFSKKFIDGFIKRNKINMEEYEEVEYKSFNDFFIRQVKKGCRPFPKEINALAAPCDGKLSAYPITWENVFYIKESKYDIYSMLQNKDLAEEFVGGTCLIFRLTPDDYHRYYYIDDGQTIAWKRIDGVLHTVRPISGKHYNVYAQNSREYMVMQTANYGKVIQMEVGALFVGRINNYDTSGWFNRGDEKGMFEFGGSTVVMLFQKDKVAIDSDIYYDTWQNKEIIVKAGNKIGEKPQ